MGAYMSRYPGIKYSFTKLPVVKTLWSRKVSTDHLKLCGNCSFQKDFRTRIFNKIKFHTVTKLKCIRIKYTTYGKLKINFSRGIYKIIYYIGTYLLLFGKKKSLSSEVSYK